ncbi:MAG: hypothetical protein GX957_04765 [Clostridiaceae bacterium]|nr:hypothetical protein [Clostridiaceae bacterium]
MGNAPAESLNEYKSYIQRRRVNDDKSQNDTVSNLIDISYKKGDIEPDKKTDRSLSEVTMDNIDEFFTQTTKKAETNALGSDIEFNFKSVSDDFARNNKSNIERISPLKDLFREDKYENQKVRTFPKGYSFSREKYKSPVNSATYKSPSRYSAEIEDNRTTLLAIKVIKQSLACFAILGLVVLMQNISSLSGVLAFLRRHLVETHIDHEAVFLGVENIIKECSRFLGGSP